MSLLLPHTSCTQSRVCLLGTASPRVYVGTKEALALTPPSPLHGRLKASWAPTLLPSWLGTLQEFKRSPCVSALDEWRTAGVTLGLGQDPYPLQGLRTFPDPKPGQSWSPSLSCQSRGPIVEEQGLWTPLTH